MELHNASSDGSGGVESLNGLTGDVVLAAGTNITLVPVGNTITINSVNDTTAVWGSITGTLSNQTDLQSALDLKAPLISPTFATSITGSYLTESEILITNGSKNIVSAAVATYPSLTELTYVKGVTSAIQTQLTARALTATTITIAGTANQITSSAGAQDLSANRTWTLSLPADVLIPTVLTVPNTGLHLLDTNASHDLIIKPGSNITADRTLTVTTGDTDIIVDVTAVTDGFVLTYDTGTNSWRGEAASGGGASTALDNLAAVAINTSLVSDTTNTDDLGSSSVLWRHTYTTDIELGHATDNTLTASGGVLSIEGVVIPTISSASTLTNKRITKRVVTASDATSVTPNTDSADWTYQLNTQATGTLTMNADAGTPTNCQAWGFKIKSTNVQTFSWNAVFVGGTVALPTVSSGGSNIDYFTFIYDTVDSKWHFTGQALNF